MNNNFIATTCCFRLAAISKIYPLERWQNGPAQTKVWTNSKWFKISRTKPCWPINPQSMPCNQVKWACSLMSSKLNNKLEGNVYKIDAKTWFLKQCWGFIFIANLLHYHCWFAGHQLVAASSSTTTTLNWERWACIGVFLPNLTHKMQKTSRQAVSQISIQSMWSKR